MDDLINIVYKFDLVEHYAQQLQSTYSFQEQIKMYKI